MNTALVVPIALILALGALSNAYAAGYTYTSLTYSRADDTKPKALTMRALLSGGTWLMVSSIAFHDVDPSSWSCK